MALTPPVPVLMDVVGSGTLISQTNLQCIPSALGKG